MIQLQKRCPPPWEITRATAEGLSPSLQEHLGQCQDCRTLYEEESSLSALAPSLSRKGFSQERRFGTKQQLLQVISQAPPAPLPPRRRWWVALAASLLLLFGGGYWFFFTASQEAPLVMRGKVFASKSAQFQQEGPPGQETVTLTEGNITVEVEHLQPGERFVVATQDAEVQVWGTRFEVVAKEGKLQSVHVFEGKVEVRYQQQQSIFLFPKEEWTRPTPASTPQKETPKSAPVSLPASAPTLAPMTPTTTPKASAPPKPTPAEEAFADGFSFMREGKFSDAALAFGRAAKSGGSLVEDALFWQSVALGRAGKAGEARAALERFLALYPSSPRAGEAALALGWLLHDSGDKEGARRWFLVAARDPSETVQQRANDALEQTKE